MLDEAWTRILAASDVEAARAELARSGPPADEAVLVAACIACPRSAGDEADAVLDLLLDGGLDPDVVGENGWRPLHHAVMGDRPEVVARLRSADASLDGGLMGTEGGTPLALALFYGRRPQAALLADDPRPRSLRTAAGLGTDLDHFVDDDGRLTPAASTGLDFQRPTHDWPSAVRPIDDQHILDDALTYAARNGRLDAMAWLVDNGADVNAVPYRGTPLWWATFADDPAAVTWLLEHGADPDLRHDFGGADHGLGATALHLGAQYGHIDALRALLEAGADPTIRDARWDATPRDWAVEADSPDALAVLDETSA